MQGTAIKETSIGDIYVGAADLPVSLVVSSIDTDMLSIVEISFTTAYAITQGYWFQDGQNLEGEQSRIIVEFETYESYKIDLDGNHDASNNVNCEPITGIIARTGQSLICVLTFGTTGANPNVQHYPATITISNFEAIAANTAVELHLPVIKNPATDTWKPEITVGVKRIDSRARDVWIHNKKTTTLTAVTAFAGHVLVSGQTCSVADP